jgi:hypothetical protein
MVDESCTELVLEKFFRFWNGQGSPVFPAQEMLLELQGFGYKRAIATQLRSQPRDEEDLQKYGHERQSLCGTTAGLLRRIAGQGDEAGYGSPHART